MIQDGRSNSLEDNFSVLSRIRIRITVLKEIPVPIIYSFNPFLSHRWAVSFRFGRHLRSPRSFPVMNLVPGRLVGTSLAQLN